MNKLWHCDACWNLHSIFICYRLKFIKFYLPTQIWDCLSRIFGYYLLTAMYGMSWFSLLEKTVLFIYLSPLSFRSLSMWYCMCKVIFLPNFWTWEVLFLYPGCLSSNSHFLLAEYKIYSLYLLSTHFVSHLNNLLFLLLNTEVEHFTETAEQTYDPIILRGVMTWKTIIWALSAMKACESCNAWVAFGCFKNEHIRN